MRRTSRCGRRWKTRSAGAGLSAVYAIVAFVTVPFLVFVVPRVYFSLHPDIITPTGKLEMGARTLQVFLASLAGFTGPVRLDVPVGRADRAKEAAELA